MSVKAGTSLYLPFTFPQTELLAPTDIELIAPETGFIQELYSTVQTAITTGGTLNVKTGNALAVTVAGLQQTIADAATKGTRQLTTATAGSSTRAVTKGDRIVISASAGFATAGAMAGHITLVSADVSPALPAA